MARWVKVQPYAAVVYTGMSFVALFVRIAVYFCIGFGGASMAGLSLWWGLPFAILSAYTVGNAWAWFRREGRVLELEQAVDIAERGAE